MRIREAGFALRVVRRRQGVAAIVYRRTLDEKREERLTRIAAIGPLAFTACGTRCEPWLAPRPLSPKAPSTRSTPTLAPGWPASLSYAGACGTQAGSTVPPTTCAAWTPPRLPGGWGG